VARLAVLASGSGSNFEAIARAMESWDHELSLLICDRKGAGAFSRADRLGIPSALVEYQGKTRQEAEEIINLHLEKAGIDMIALAGFMRLLTPWFVQQWKGRLVNIHPSLLPQYPGTHSIERAWEAGEIQQGISIHWVDEGMDTGSLIFQAKVDRRGLESLEEMEEKIHNLEHTHYPRIIKQLLDSQQFN